ncbi:flotillin family protein [Cryobacterium sp. TMT1-3]|uniref:Flotillin family protein n=1 Tax=Cryobacterium luteum TaxID=1424661 RepID=A0A1H8KAN0_9MICO|nr:MULTISPECIES: SPFH domain-containing protein [Cryobacterium]TFB92397.1 flotillin family protein [Cryobacterium luteum]TFC25048.1 flotillin family protein [Cryobacterium sp. TMT1-3]SEN89905.1 flotillin [Cryobacterium luteum]
MLDFLFSPIPGIIFTIVVVLLIGLIYAKTIYKNAGPDEALIITGKKSRKTIVDGATLEESGQRVVHGQGVFITPFFQKAFKISLRSRAIEITAVAQDRNGITLSVEAVAIVKVGDDPAAIRAAAQRFLGQDKNIDGFAQEVLSGSLRSSIGATDVMTVIQKRDELGSSVLATARESLANQGLDVDSFEIKGITDENDYIRDIGRAEQAKVRRQAEVAEHVANRESQEALITAEQAIAEAQNTLALRRAALQLDTDKASAEAAASKPLAEAKAQQAIVQEQELTAQRRASLRKAELESEVNAIADADAYRIRVTAIAAAEASVAKATADRDSRVANSEATRAEGQAEADAILARGTAEATATRLSAEAVAQQSEALIQLRLVEMLPQIAHELAAPMGNIDQLTVISTDGASQLSKNVASGFSEVDAVLGSTMGIGIKDLLGGLLGGTAGAALRSSGPARAGASASPAAGAAPRSTVTDAAVSAPASIADAGSTVSAVTPTSVSSSTATAAAAARAAAGASVADSIDGVDFDAVANEAESAIARAAADRLPRMAGDRLLP